MNIIILLLVASLSVAIIFLIAFIWAVKDEQYNDCQTPAIRMLFDDEKIKNVKNNIESNN
ncbi:MAG: cbb3-type cytochrome oxidase assembly protein CcoS [Candidatus Cloacimonadota bacterium]|nr:MAG: cbb3-type cytochrome oxidase assembly protein CcoS [Candidatus Cloacimonadota bacterium]